MSSAHLVGDMRLAKSEPHPGEVHRPHRAEEHLRRADRHIVDAPLLQRYPAHPLAEVGRLERSGLRLRLVVHPCQPHPIKNKREPERR